MPVWSSCCSPGTHWTHSRLSASSAVSPHTPPPPQPQPPSSPSISLVHHHFPLNPTFPSPSTISFPRPSLYTFATPYFLAHISCLLPLSPTHLPTSFLPQAPPPSSPTPYRLPHLFPQPQARAGKRVGTQEGHLT